MSRYYPDFRNRFEEYASHVKRISRFGQDEKTRDFFNYVLNTAEAGNCMSKLEESSGELKWGTVGSKASLMDVASGPMIRSGRTLRGE